MLKIIIRSLVFSIVMILTGHAVFAADNNANAILGIWVTEGGKSHVEIVLKNGHYAGNIVWLKEPDYPADDKQGMAGKPKVDRENPEIALRIRPVIGLPLLSGFRYSGDNVWSDGSIYDPESGKTYRCKMTLMKNGELKVRGYIGFSLFGRTTVWTRFPLAPST